MYMSQTLHRFINKLAKFTIWILLLYAISFAIWTVFYTETGNGDNVEHIHAAWLVVYGKLPYRDFFQHHNPLLWYVFAPFVRSVTDIQFLLDAAHAIGICAGIATFYVIFKLSVRFFASKYASLLSLLILCPPYFYIYCFNFNPDTFMALCFAIGIYKLFSYLEKPKLDKLVWSFLFFFFAFMFTQKILIIFALLGLICLVVFYRLKTPLNNIIYALILPCLGLCLFLAYLYNQNALEIYWQSNFLFNIVMQDYYGNYKVNVIDYQMLIFSTALASIGILCFFCKENRYFQIISILFIMELLLRCFYFSLSPYYLLPLMLYTVCLNSVVLEKLITRNIIFFYLGLCVSFYYAYISPKSYLSARGNDRSFVYFLAQNITPCDYVISSYFGNQSIIYKDPSYYWSMLGHIDLAGEEAGIAPKPNLTELVLKYKPKLIYGGIYWNSYEQNRGRYVPIQQISVDVIEKYYQPTPFKDFYLLKEDDDNLKCQYDAAAKEWLYVR